MLVTELAPLGALCDYLPENKVCVNCPKLSLRVDFYFVFVSKAGSALPCYSKTLLNLIFFIGT